MVDRDELLRRVDLHGLLDEVCPQPASRAGPGARWRCPDPTHDDVHPSVTMFIDRHGIGRWRCWSGGHGGTAIDALATSRRLSVREAIEHLAHRTHLEPDPTGWPTTPTRPPAATVPDPAVLDYVAACRHLLWTRTGRRVLDWLTHTRGLDPSVLEANQIGADPGPGLLPRPPGLPRGGPAAVLPTLTPDGDVASLQARYLDPEPGHARYRNPTAALAPNPRLAWITPTRPASTDVLLVCEGIPDALTAGTAGLPAVALLGATLPDPALAARIAHHTAGRQVWLALDNDPAGHHATHQLKHLLHHYNIPTHQLQLPAGVDLNQHAATHPDWPHQLDPAAQQAQIEPPACELSRALR